MARLPYLTHSDLAPEHQDLLKRDITLHRQLVHSPNGFKAFHTLSEFIRYGSKVDPRLRELAILQVGYLTRSPYEWSHHIKLGYDFGVSDADIRGLLKAAREMTNDMKISDATFAALRRDLDNERVVDLVIAIGFYNAVVRVLATLEIDVEPDYQQYLDRYPLPPDGP
jgi:alkylhydroperoxidase family enzyme